ncbi:hypothetical protein BRDID11002_61660 [Bradyrhizobium diazoefficiens]
MKPRMNYYQAAPDTLKALIAVDDQIKASGLEQSLIELVKTRASQINGCAFCINMHTEDARKRGETEQRLYLLNAWRESPLYTDRERAALAWTEAVTLISETHAPDDIYEQVRAQFSEQETVNLTTLIGTINAVEQDRDLVPRGPSGEGEGVGGVRGGVSGGVLDATPLPHAQLSCPAKAGHPVRRSLSIHSRASRSTGSPAFAGDDT